MKKMNRIKNRALALTLGMTFLLTGCGSNGGTTAVTPDQPAPESRSVNLSENVSKIDIPETNLATEHSVALSKSGFQMLNTVIEAENLHNQNVLISPTSIQFALGMTATGSVNGSATQKELMEALLPGCNATPADLNAEMATFAKRMNSSENESWNVANSVWVKTGDTVKLRESFISDVTNYYAAELYSAPFDNSTVKEINAWVNKNTKERIPEIIDHLDPETVIALVNAMAFDGEWAEELEGEDIKEDITFTNADGTTKKVTMLSTHERRAILLNGGIGFIRPYKGNEYSFVAILPDANQTAEEYLAGIVSGNSNFAEAYLNADTKRGVNAMIPEFKAEFGANLNNTLKAMGVKEAYTSTAGFKEMVTDDSTGVLIGDVIHKTMIKVDRQGTEAAAATIVLMDKAAAPMVEDPPYSVILNRPFIYGIVDNATGVPIFLGIQNTME